MRGIPARAVLVAPTAAWRGGLLYAIAGIAGLSVVFYYRQNVVGQIGGPISVEKILWLNYAITAWFVVPAFLVRHSDLHPGLRQILGWFLASMVARGLVELWLLYVTVSWDPVYGIGHDLLNIGLILALRLRLPPGAGPAPDDFNRDVRRFTTTLALGLVAEIVFAALFRRTGVHAGAVYFAAPTAAFSDINRLTRVVDVLAYAELTRLLCRQRHRLFFRG